MTVGQYLEQNGISKEFVMCLSTSSSSNQNFSIDYWDIEIDTLTESQYNLVEEIISQIKNQESDSEQQTQLPLEPND